MASICLVNALFPPDSHGGAENYVFRLARALDERDHEVCVVTTKPYDGLGSIQPGRTTYEGITVWRFYPANLYHRSEGGGRNPISKAIWHQIDTVNPHAASAVGRILDRVEPDVVHTNNLMGIGATVARAIQNRSIRHVHTLHDYSLICPKSNLLRNWTAPDHELVGC